MNGKNAPNSLRYAYSRDAVNHHIKNGMSRDEAEALVSMDWAMEMAGGVISNKFIFVRKQNGLYHY